MLALESPPESNSIACSSKVQVHEDVYSIGTVLLTIFLLMVLMMLLLVLLMTMMMMMKWCSMMLEITMLKMVTMM